MIRGALTMKLPVLTLLVLGGTLGCASTRSTNPTPPSARATLTQVEQQAMTPGEVLGILEAGNERFARG